jgi:hypothetical protein
MSITVYGPESFTVGADINLDTYDPNWSKITAVGTGIMIVRAATDELHVSGNGLGSGYTWNGQTLLDQRLTAKLIAANSSYPGITNRQIANSDGYLAEWQATEGLIHLYRVSASWVTFTSLATGGIVAHLTSYPNAYVKVTGTNPCHITVGDDVNGEVIAIDDSNAPRYTSGQPGITTYPFIATEPAIDDISIFDETEVVSVLRSRKLATQQRMVA